MGKKRTRSTVVSKGERRNVVAGIKAARSEMPVLTRALNKAAAWRAGKNPWITIENPNKSETNRRFIRVSANALYGDPRRRAVLYKGNEAE